jgi:hypothetical protein
MEQKEKSKIQKTVNDRLFQSRIVIINGKVVKNAPTIE